ncbi:conserved hypothetical protein [Sphingomonas aurantiaca]|uniref:Uncharacterized protein n=1 Tax=Sphingomonas aurantiaca TaxID=185949 RepID=A0A5E8AA71_9SPHN|nr:conserved hypothetical protein [Sphingomonas aurantiaca]
MRPFAGPGVAMNVVEKRYDQAYRDGVHDSVRGGPVADGLLRRYRADPGGSGARCALCVPARARRPAADQRV